MATTYGDLSLSQTTGTKKRASVTPKNARHAQGPRIPTKSAGIPAKTDEHNGEGIKPTSTIPPRRCAVIQPKPTRRYPDDLITEAPQAQGTLPQKKSVTYRTILSGLQWLVIVFLAYTVLFWIVFGVTIAYNRYAYGPTHTINEDISIGGQPAHVTATNASGTIYITIYQHNPNGSTTAASYEKSQLDPTYWGDMNAIVVTMDQPTQKGNAIPTLTFHLQGNPDPWHLIFNRPWMTFHLVPTSHGYVVN